MEASGGDAGGYAEQCTDDGSDEGAGFGSAAEQGEDAADFECEEDSEDDGHDGAQACGGFWSGFVFGEDVGCEVPDVEGSGEDSGLGWFEAFAVGRVLGVVFTIGVIFVVAVMSVGSGDESAVCFADTGEVDHEECAEGEPACDGEVSGSGSADVFDLHACDEVDDGIEGYHSEQVAEEDEEEERPEERHVLIAAVLEDGSGDLFADELQESFEEIDPAFWCLGNGSGLLVGAGKSGEDEDAEECSDDGHQQVVCEVEG